jgi:hypothetical protein
VEKKKLESVYIRMDTPGSPVLGNLLFDKRKICSW